MILFGCPNPSCRRRYEVPDNRAGKSTYCANAACGWRIRVPFPRPQAEAMPGQLLDNETGSVIKDWWQEPPKPKSRTRLTEEDEQDDDAQPFIRHRSNDAAVIIPLAPALSGMALGSVIGPVVMIFPAVFLSQYFPVFGGILEKALAEPWSPARLSLIPVHLFGFGFVGLILGVMVGIVGGLAYPSRSNGKPIFSSRRGGRF